MMVTVISPMRQLKPQMTRNTQRKMPRKKATTGLRRRVGRRGGLFFVVFFGAGLRFDPDAVFG